MSLINETEKRMEKCISVLHHELSKLRTGRAHPSLLESIMVRCYGTDTPIQQVANIAVSDPQTLTVIPWDKTLVPAVEKAIMTADLGLNPVAGGENIRVPLPPLTEERRRDLVKVIKGEAENSKVSVRNIRRDANNQVKEALKAKTISEDDERREQDRIQKITDKYIAKIDEMIAAKETDLMAM
ncbi:MAG: ribosome recycling factor [Gammaproteobacteria bacterium]